VLVGGPGEGPLCRQIAEQLGGRVVDLSERTTLLELAAVIAAADVFLSGDTGPMHLAAAVGTPVVSLFTCTSPLRAGPRGNESRIVATQVPCAASYLKRCSLLSCMQELTPDRVWPVLRAALAEPRPASRRAG
jgi:ADP-heptose:LPS heptosyltransferase